MITSNYLNGFHDRISAFNAAKTLVLRSDTQFTYTFENFFHPFIGELIAKQNSESLPGMLDAKWQEEELCNKDFFKDLFNANESDLIKVNCSPKEIDVSNGGPYSNYNWELFFHIPMTIAVHLSKTQRFAEAQRWFHFIFNPTLSNQSVDSTKRFWNFLAFRKQDRNMRIEDIVRLLSIPSSELSHDDQLLQKDILNGYDDIRNKPFQPHAVGRTRYLAYQYSVVMKYLDNLIAWGDQLFQQDTVESINEAIQLYVLAANILGERPQLIPSHGKVRAKTFAQLKEKGLGSIGDALVDLEGQLPLNFATQNSRIGGSDPENSSALFSIGRTLYFCIPRNDKLLGYWDTVADRLFKIRHCMNIEGVVRPLALFDPPVDPSMLVKAAAAGIDIGSIINGLNQPISPVRSLFLLQKSLELCGEVRTFGNALLSSMEKGDTEQLTLIRQSHEIQIQQMSQEVRFLQWKSVQETTKSLLISRKTVLERLHYYQRLFGLPADQNAPDDLKLDPSEKQNDPPKLTEENFTESYKKLVDQYDKQLTLQKLADLIIVDDNDPSQQSGASGKGQLYLNNNEGADHNIHGPAGHIARQLAMAIDTLHGPLAFVPEVNADLHYWGLGAHATVFGGSMLVNFGHLLSNVANMRAAEEEYSGSRASKTAGYQRRADEWLFQYNLAAHELMQIGRQILTSLIAEEIAYHEYLSIKQQIKNVQEVDQFLHDKFTNEELYLWMQGETSRLYYEYYRFAFDTARKAERTMKQELMRPEVDAQDFIKFNYWDGGRKGLLSGEALYLDVKRMEMAYHENNKREFELTKHVSLRQLNPVALLTLKSTGTCQVTIPEWLYDLDCPGHYMRRIKSVALSIPSVVGPYTSVNCTLSLLKSSLRKSPVGQDYMRQGSEDDRFIDYIGSVQSIVTSGGINDSGLFETNLRDERFLPFEGAGAESTWKLDLPKGYHSFDYSTISDVILHIRYTARQGVDPMKVEVSLDNLFQQVSESNLGLLLSLRHEFPSEWYAFVNGTSNLTATIRKDFFPYFVQGKKINIESLDLYNGQDITKHDKIGVGPVTDDLAEQGKFIVSLEPTKVLSREADSDVFLIVSYSLNKEKQ